jgi:hypothetical protein
MGMEDVGERGRMVVRARVAMNNLTTVLSGQGKYEEAEKMHRDALGLNETLLDKEHPDKLTSMMTWPRTF